MDLTEGKETKTIKVEVAFALPERQFLIQISCLTPITIREAIQQSGVTGLFPDFDFSRTAQGVFGQTRDPETPLADGDRVEIYRELLIDPRLERRERSKREPRKVSKEPAD